MGEVRNLLSIRQGRIRDPRSRRAGTGATSGGSPGTGGADISGNIRRGRCLSLVDCSVRAGQGTCLDRDGSVLDRSCDFGGIGARAGGSGMLRPTLRVTFWGAVAMADTAFIGLLVGCAV